MPFTSKIHTSQSCRIWLDSSSFIRLVSFDKAGSHSIELDVLPSACTVFVEVVFEGDAAVPVLDFAAFCPEADVDGTGEERIFLNVVMWREAMTVEKLKDCKRGCDG